MSSACTTSWVHIREETGRKVKLELMRRLAMLKVWFPILHLLREADSTTVYSVGWEEVSTWQEGVCVLACA